MTSALPLVLTLIGVLPSYLCNPPSPPINVWTATLKMPENWTVGMKRMHRYYQGSINLIGVLDFLDIWSKCVSEMRLKWADDIKSIRAAKFSIYVWCDWHDKLFLVPSSIIISEEFQKVNGLPAQKKQEKQSHFRREFFWKATICSNFTMVVTFLHLAVCFPKTVKRL